MNFLFRAHTFFLILNDGNKGNGKVLSLSINTWKTKTSIEKINTHKLAKFVRKIVVIDTILAISCKFATNSKYTDPVCTVFLNILTHITTNLSWTLLVIIITTTKNYHNPPKPISFTLFVSLARIVYLSPVLSHTISHNLYRELFYYFET